MFTQFRYWLSARVLGLGVAIIPDEISRWCISYGLNAGAELIKDTMEKMSEEIKE